MCYSYLLFDKPAQALEYCERALPLNQQADDRSKITSTLTFMGMAHSAMLNQTKALDYYQQALRQKGKDGERRSTAIVLDKIGLLYAALGEPKKAMTSYKEALQLWQSLRDQDGETITLHNMARAESADGNLVEANNYLRKAIDLVEFRRGTLTSQMLRTTYFANKENYYELDIDLKMRLAKATGSQEYVALALGSSEQGRARNLLDILKEANIKLDTGGDPATANPQLRDLVESQRVIGRKLSVKANARTSLLGGEHTKEQVASLDKDIDELNAEYDRIESKIRTSNPRYAEITSPHPLHARDIQQQLSDNTTTLISYALGEQRSYVWAVSPTSIEAFELPARRTIEDAAQRVYDLLTARNREEPGETFAQKNARRKRAEAEYNQEAQALSTMLLGKLSPFLGSKRLVIVADGALQMIPFGALPPPGGSTAAQELTPNESRNTGNNSQVHMIDAHEIIPLPSASVLALQRREFANRKQAPLAVAVLADPVYDSQDGRVAKATGNGNQQGKHIAKSGEAVELSPNHTAPPPQATSGSTPAPLGPASEHSELATALRDVGLSQDGKLGRLSFSRREAMAIARTVSPGQSLSALDFKASRETATSPELSKYRIIHFATHGLLDLEHPELSGIVLSMVDEKGQPQDGYLRLHEIYNLNLPAELVVLSACQTGIGKQIRGEGLIALTRGFMYAGARSVVASLWKVDDAATSALMAEFYKQMFTNKRKPAAALREAQRKISQQPLWKSPYYWAGFFIQGEWN
jgi:CHAT domain-containing protein